MAERVTRDAGGRPIELVRLVATADRTVLVYDELPITPQARIAALAVTYSYRR